MLGVFQKNYSCEHLDRFFFCVASKGRDTWGLRIREMPYDSEIFVPTLGRSKRTVRAKLQFYLPKKSFVWTISPTKQPHQIEVIKFWKTCWMKWDFGEDFCFSDLVSNLKKSQCPTVLFFSRQDEYVRNSPKFPNFTQKNTISWKVNFCPVFPGNSSTGGLRISPSFFFVCAVFGVAQNCAE